MTIWAFNKAGNPESVGLVYQSVKGGKSRFGWSSEDQHNLKLEGNWTPQHPKQLFLLDIKRGDWIVHINTPSKGVCVAAKVLSGYDFDQGLKHKDGRVEFRHCIEVAPDSVIEFDRRSPAVLGSVNLRPRQRYHRVKAVEDFLQSIDNLKSGFTGSKDDHLRVKADKLLPEISELIHKMHPRKELEHFLAEVFRRVPGVVGVVKNGFGWRTDHGADLIVTMGTPLGSLELEHRVIVQAKSYGETHHDLQAVGQVKEGIEHFDGAAGMIMTTAKKSEALEAAVSKASEETGVPIDLLDAEDLARFVIKHAPELVFSME